MAVKNQTNKKLEEESFRFTVVLPPEVAGLFMQDCNAEDRNHSEMARHIIKQHYRRMEDQRRIIKGLPSGESGRIPHFEGGPRRDLPQDANA